MLRKYKNLIKKHFSRPKVIVIVCIIMGVYLGINLTKEIINRHQINEKIGAYKEEIARLEKENNEILQLISSWESGGELEKEARLKLGLQRPGENTILILRNTDDPSTKNIISPNSEIIGGMIINNSNDNISNYKKWLKYFFK